MNPHNTPTPSRVNRRGLLVGALGAGAAAIAAVAFAIPAIIGTSVAATALTQPAAGGPAAMCAQVTPEAVAAAGTSFRADVRSIADGTVTLGGTATRIRLSSAGDLTMPDGSTLGFDPEGWPLVSAPGQPARRGPFRLLGLRPEARRTAGLLALIAATVPLPRAR